MRKCIRMYPLYQDLSKNPYPTRHILILAQSIKSAQLQNNALAKNLPPAYISARNSKLRPSVFSKHPFISVKFPTHFQNTCEICEANSLDFSSVSFHPVVVASFYSLIKAVVKISHRYLLREVTPENSEGS